MFIINETERDYYYNGKFELTDKLRNSLRLKKVSEIHAILV